MTTTNETILGLIKRHVLRDGEAVVRVKRWPDGLALATSLRHFNAGPEPGDWTISAEEWVDDVVIAIRDDLIIEGEPERFGFLLLANGDDVYLNDPDAVAQLGRRLASGMNPLGYAEILVAFHPYSSATRAVVPEADGLRRVFDRPGLPAVAPLRLGHGPRGVTLTFTSFARYSRLPGGAPLLDLTEWTVDAPAGEPARWVSLRTAEGIRLDPGRSQAPGTPVRRDTEGTPAITLDEAARIAEKWVRDSTPTGVSLTPLVHEFDLGYVVSARQEPGDPPVSGRGIIDKETGELSVWPGLPVESIIERYRARRASEPPRLWTWDPAEQARWDLEHVATPAALTNLHLADHVIRARSVKGDAEPHHHPLVVDFMHNALAAEHRIRGYDRCSEAVAISDALHEEDARRGQARERRITLEEARTGLFGGARIATFRVREPADPVAGTSAPPCLSCAMLARHFGFLLIPPASPGSKETRSDG